MSWLKIDVDRVWSGQTTHVGELVESGEEVVEDAHQLFGLARRREG